MSAGDFYYGINATFRFVHDSWGKEALVDYWTSMAHEYHAEVSDLFRDGGLDEVERYWSDYFAKEPGGEVTVRQANDQVEIRVDDCPAFRWLKNGEREIVPYYCEHCQHVSTVIAKEAGMAFKLEGGNGTCRQFFGLKEA